MGTVVNNNNNQSFAVYGTLDGATAYWSMELTPAALAWANPANDARLAPALVQATRRLDRLAYLGLPVAPPVIDVSLAWPRTGIAVLVDGQFVDPATIPDRMIKAAYELAGLILVTPAITTKTTTGSNVRKVDAGGGVGVTFFLPTGDTDPILPPQVLDLIAPLLGEPGTSGAADGADVSGSKASGTDYKPCDQKFGIVGGL